jgi:hypothetical protein
MGLELTELMPLWPPSRIIGLGGFGQRPNQSLTGGRSNEIRQQTAINITAESIAKTRYGCVLNREGEIVVHKHIPTDPAGSQAD